MTIEVLQPGLQSSVQSGPRIGMRHCGVPSCGAADPLSLALANRLVGNEWDAAAIEMTLTGATLRFERRCGLALAGAPAAVQLNGQALPMFETRVAEAGDVLSVGAITAGARAYVAVAGGLHVPSVMGSTATDLQAGFGGHEGRALESGDRLQTNEGDFELIQTPNEYRAPVSHSWAIRACESAETGLLDAASRELLFESSWTVSRRADRMGIRLEDAHLDIDSDGRMPSSAVFPGAIQCPEDGAPYILSVDAGTVGGYPRVAQVARMDRHVLGQLRPGDRVRLARRDYDQAVEELKAKHDYWRPWLPAIESII